MSDISQFDRLSLLTTFVGLAVLLSQKCTEEVNKHETSINSRYNTTHQRNLDQPPLADSHKIAMQPSVPGVAENVTFTEDECADYVEC